MKILTPFFVISIVSIIYSLYLFIIDTTGWGALAAFYIGIVGIVLFFIDMLIKLFKLTYIRIALVQSFLIMLVFFVYSIIY